MAAPSYAQAMREANFPPMRQYGLGLGSEGDASSIPDVSSTVTFSDTDESDARSFTSSRARRTFGSSHKTMSKSRSGRAYPRGSLSPVPSSPSINGIDMEDGMSTLSRATSMYSLSRISFSSRLAQLTSIPLPTASSLSAKISSQATAHLAARCLSEAGEQIKIWTTKASDVLEDLNSEDDVEWSAAGGHDGVEEVEQAITRFEGLVKVYVICIEELQLRADVRTLSDQTLKTHVDQMEDVALEWSRIKRSLKDIKEQIEIALEWEDLWTGAVGDIAQELGSLSDLIFEMEEERHQTATRAESTLPQRREPDHAANASDGKKALQTPTPARSRLSDSMRFSPGSPVELPSAASVEEDSKLLALFARMQPMRAALDFLPMRISTFRVRGNAMFPSGCIQLDSRRDELENQWQKLERDAEALRKELGEDRWLVVFRNAGTQALKMFDSVERSQTKLSHAITTRQHKLDPIGFARLVENFEAKKVHYLPAVDRVLALIDRGVRDRLSVNGEILRLQSEMKRRHACLQGTIRDVESSLAGSGFDQSGQQLRDSISTIMSERSRTSSAVDTQHSSPASSIILRTGNSNLYTTTPSKFATTRRTSNIGLPPFRPRASDVGHTISARQVSEPYTGKKNELFRDFKQPANKPRWSLAGGPAVQHDFLPLSATESSPYRKPEVSPRKYTPSAPRTSLLPGAVSRNMHSPEPRDTPLTAHRNIPARASSSLDYHASPRRTLLRSRPSLVGLQDEQGTPSRLPLRTRPSLAALPSVRDEGEERTPSKLPRPSFGRPESSLSNHGASPSPMRRYVSAETGAGARRESLASITTMSTLGAGRRTVSAAVGTSRTGAGQASGRDSRAGSRAGSRLESRPGWRF